MATPNADRLKTIESWSADSIHHANSMLKSVGGRMRTIAEINRGVASNLGLEGTAAEAVSSRLDPLAKRLEELGIVVKNSKTSIDGSVHKDRRLLTGDSPLAGNALGILTAEELLKAAGV